MPGQADRSPTPPTGARALTPANPGYPASVPPSYPGAMPAGGGRVEGPDIRQYVGIVLSRWWLILLFLLLGAGVGLVRIYRSTPLYRATCRIEVVQDPRLSFGGDRERPSFIMMDQEITRRIIVLQSGLLNGQVREALLDEWTSQVPEEHRSPRIAVSPFRDTRTMLDVSVDATVGKYALAYLSELLEKYQDLRRSELATANDTALRSLKAEREDVYRQLQEGQAELAQFLSERSILINEAKATWDERFLTSLIQRQNALRMERAMLETQFGMLDKLSAGTIQEVVGLSMETHQATLGQMAAESAAAAAAGRGERAAPAPMTPPVVREQADWQTHELELARLEAEYAEQLKTYKETHPRMRALMVRIEGVRRDLKLTAEMAIKRLQERLRAVAMQEEALKKAVDTWQAELSLTVADRAQYQTLTAKVEHLQKLHDSVFQRVVEGNVLNIDAVYTRMVERPRMVGLIWPNNTKVMATSILIAFVLSLGLAFLMHNFDTTLLDIGAVEERFGITYISGIPHWGRLLKNFSNRGNAVIVTREKSNVATEVYRTVRGTLEQVLGQGDGPIAIAVTSSDSGDGKSLTTLNLAVVFAWTGKRVLLVDGDLRRGALHKPLGVESGKGFTELLTGSVADWREVVRTNAQEGMDFISAGQYLQESESPEQLGSQRMRDLLRQWRENYDIIVFDTAPVSRVMDTAVLARSCDGVLLVARFAKTRVAELQHLLRRLEGTRVLGFVVNCIDFHKLSRSYYGYSGYGYGYRDYGYGYYRYYSYYRPYGERKEDAGAAGKAIAAAPPADRAGK